MFATVLLTAICVPGFQDDPTTTVPEAAVVKDGEHPIVAAVRTALESNGGRTDRPFMMVVSIQSSEPKKIISAFKTPLVETRKEPGNIIYLLNQDASEPEKFLVVERWKSLDALKMHLEQPYLEALLKEIEPISTVELQVLKTVGQVRRDKKKPNN